MDTSFSAFLFSGEQGRKQTGEVKAAERSQGHLNLKKNKKKTPEVLKPSCTGVTGVGRMSDAVDKHTNKIASFSATWRRGVLPPAFEIESDGRGFIVAPSSVTQTHTLLKSTWISKGNKRPSITLQKHWRYNSRVCQSQSLFQTHGEFRWCYSLQSSCKTMYIHRRIDKWKKHHHFNRYTRKERRLWDGREVLLLFVFWKLRVPSLSATASGIKLGDNFLAGNNECDPCTLSGWWDNRGRVWTAWIQIHKVLPSKSNN